MQQTIKVKKRKVKKKLKIILFVLVVIFIGIFITVKTIEYHNTYGYKLGELGYSKEEIITIKELKDNQIDEILKKDYDSKIITFIKQDYFIFDNLDEYISYIKDNSDLKPSKVVVLVNVKTNHDHYDEEVISATDTSKGILMLVNKYHYLTKEYAPDDIVEISNYYSYADNSIKEEVYEAYVKMWKAAKKEDLTLIVTSSYRDYETQDYLWNSRADASSEENADSSTARAGYSEHQSGLALDIVTYNVTFNDFEATDEFKWLSENAYIYGFILRYPKDKTEITGYDYESWHYRYVGVETATKINKLGITFDEYYAYYIDNK